MGTGMGSKEAERQPATIDILGRSCDKTAHVVTPEGEAAQSEGDAAAEIAQHADIGGSSITAPMKRIALGTSPGTSCPDDSW